MMYINDFNTLDPKYSEITDEISRLAGLCASAGVIDPALYTQHKVNRGLRDLEGNGVLTGLTDISEIQAFEYTMSGDKIPMDGQLYFRGYEIKDLVKGFIDEDRFGFEETTYLLIFGKLPTEQELEGFNNLLAEYRSLPTSFVRDIILKAPSLDMMNTLARSVLTLHAYDTRANDTDIPNVLRQSLLLTAVFPMLAVYGYQAYRHYFEADDLFINKPKGSLSTAENILRMLRRGGRYTDLEARILDIALVLHAEHGGGNNSTFTTHVVTSSGTDTYSSVAASLGSLKGPKHGGANIKVVQMFDDIKKNVRDWDDEEEVANYLKSILNKEVFDKQGLIYGMGHAVYSISDPRADIFKTFVEKLSVEKKREEEYRLYSNVARLAPEVIGEVRQIYKGVSANVDFYSGFVYSMLDLPKELFTPLFAIARISGWSAHRIEELINASKIIRPAYMSVSGRHGYVPLTERAPTERI
ncbi:MAG: citrate/2-methylcitrate synthase [Clostridiales Family XIII bacterium]|jgi:citrate synthase|nr:citrate/2-methylcitrate synthase [Clostridiales Family XIII bacterium]